MRTIDAKSLDILRYSTHTEDIYEKGLLAPTVADALTFDDNGVAVQTFTLIDSNGQPLADRVASRIVYDSINFDSPAQSTDERFWVTLAFGDHLEYARKRWDRVLRARSPEALRNHLNNHFFCATARNRFRDHAIARLWWLRRFIETSGQLDRAKAEDLFFGEGFSDFPVQLLGRPNLAALSNLSAELVDFAHKIFVSDGRKYDRGRVRNMLQNLDILAGHQVPALMGDSEIRSAIEKAYVLGLDLDEIPD